MTELVRFKKKIEWNSSFIYWNPQKVEWNGIQLIHRFPRHKFRYGQTFRQNSDQILVCPLCAGASKTDPTPRTNFSVNGESASLFNYIFKLWLSGVPKICDYFEWSKDRSNSVLCNSITRDFKWFPVVL